MQDPDVINVQKAIRDILVALPVNAVYLELWMELVTGTVFAREMLKAADVISVETDTLHSTKTIHSVFINL